MTHLRQIMLEELRRRNFAETTGFRSSPPPRKLYIRAPSTGRKRNGNRYTRANSLVQTSALQNRLRAVEFEGFRVITFGRATE